jgi:DNA-binding CsgD family transcriptional regulator
MTPYFDDSGQPIPVTWPQMPPVLEPAELLETILESLPDRAKALRAIESAFSEREDAAGDRRAADALHVVFQRLGEIGGKRGNELRAALLLSIGISPHFAEQAKCAGVARQTFFKAVTRLMRKLDFRRRS